MTSSLLGENELKNNQPSPLMKCMLLTSSHVRNYPAFQKLEGLGVFRAEEIADFLAPQRFQSKTQSACGPAAAKVDFVAFVKCVSDYLVI